MKSALQMFMPDVKHVENWQIGYVLERNKKYVIESTGELQHAWQHLKKGYQMWLDPSPIKVGKKQSSANIKGNATAQGGTFRKEDQVLAIIEELKKLHGNELAPYKYRLWAEMIVVGTSTKDSIPDVPMFSAKPAKRPRREGLTDTLTVVGQTIANALTPQASTTREAPVAVEQVKNDRCSGASDKAKLRSEVIKQEIGAITVEEYEEKKKLLLQDIH